MDYPKSDATVGLVDGKFTDGNPAQGIPASRDASSWANLVTDELLNVLAEADIAADEDANTQVRDAILTIIAAQFTGSNQSLASSGYQIFPGGLIWQWGAGSSGSDGTVMVTFPIAFPTAPLAVVASLSTDIPGAQTIGTKAPTATQVFVYTTGASGPSVGTGFHYFVIGN